MMVASMKNHLNKTMVDLVHRNLVSFAMYTVFITYSKAFIGKVITNICMRVLCWTHSR